MLHETNCSNAARGLFSTKEELLCEMKSLMPSVNVKTEILSDEERIRNIQDMVNLRFLLKVEDVSILTSDIMSLGLMTNKTKRCKKTGIASTLPENSVMQPSKGKIYGRRFNGRFASKAIYKYHNLKSKISIQVEAAKKKYKLMKVRESMVECGLKWTRVDQSRALKTLEALRIPPPTPVPGPKIKKKKTEELSDREPEPRFENPYDYDDTTSGPSLPQPTGDFKCGMDFCRLGCVCQSISGTRKKLLKKAHCCQYQCMFSCHCQHLTRSRATVFGNLSPIMDSKFSFTNLNKTILPTKKKLFTPKKDKGSEDSGDEIRRKESERKVVKSPKKELEMLNGLVRKSGRLKDKSLYNSYVVLEDVIDNKSPERKKATKRRHKSLKKVKSSEISESSQSPAKKTENVQEQESPQQQQQQQECLEISSDSEVDSPPKKKKKVAASPEKSNNNNNNGFEMPSMHPNGNFRMEHVLLKKKNETDGSRQDLLVESYHDFDWKYCKKQLSSVFHENTFTENGINKDDKCVEWRNFKILLYPSKCKSSIPKHVLDRIENSNFEYVRTIITKLNKKEVVVINSPAKSSDSEDCRSISESKQPSKITPSKQPNKSGKSPEKCDKSLDQSLRNDDVIVVEDEAEELSDDSDCPGIINKVASLAPNYNKIITTTTPNKSLNIDNVTVSRTETVTTSTDAVNSNNSPNLNTTTTPMKPTTPVRPTTPVKPTTPLRPPSPPNPPEVPKYSPLKLLPGMKYINSVRFAPFIQVPFTNAAGISGCRQFRFNAVTPNPLQNQRNTPTTQATSIVTFSPSNSDPTNQSKVDIPSKYNLIKPPSIQKEKEKLLSISNGQITQPNVSIVKLPTSTVATTLGSPSSLITSQKLNASPVSPKRNSLSPLNLSMAKPPISQALETPKNVTTPPIIPPLIRPAIGSDGKKVIVLKSVNTNISSRFLLPQFYQRPSAPLSSESKVISSPVISSPNSYLPPKILSPNIPSPNIPSPNLSQRPPLRNIVTLLPKNIPAMTSLRQLPPAVIQKSNTKLIVSNKIVPLPLISKVETTKDSGSIETPDSEEESKNLATKENDISLTKIKSASVEDNSPLSDPRSENLSYVNGDEQSSKDETSFDSKSISSLSDTSDDHHLYIKRLKLLYHEIVMIENIQEKHDKMSAGDILDMILSAIKKLQDTSVELANILFAESETRKRLIKKLQEIKDNAMTKE